ncbi:hypothetical protein K0B96_06300 [Horticoccus luteus]|uniref:Uncharacterized protein n=1 Tax=Horticoccus luteus TaxID=2862869 RepID=A0A8F9TYT1_9BACT|nr:hypothetical protein [Horticoccus luteus]QYM80223.1 hypothetical protein K0B96_06300 [Horticoccus luteus]
MSHGPHDAYDQTVLDFIDHSPTGAVPHTPAYQDALVRLRSSHQVFAHAEHKDAYVTARSLAAKPSFHAANLAALAAGEISADALEPNDAIFTRYVQSLPAASRPKAEALRLAVAGRTVQHRKHAGIIAHDAVRSLFLVPGGGPHPGIPGNYLHGTLLQLSADAAAAWELHLHDSDDGLAIAQTERLADAWTLLQDVIASAPFHLSELDALGFHLT